MSAETAEAAEAGVAADEAREGFYGALRGDDAGELYDQAPCGYLSTAPDGLILKVNQTFLTLTGYREDDLVGQRRFVDLLTVGGRIYHETHYAPMLQMHGTAREIALDLVQADRRRLPVLVNSVLERDASGAPFVVRTAIFDASHRREYERELVRAKQRAEASEARAKALVRTLQQTLIPPAAPLVPGLDVAAVYRPAGEGEEIGGDFYDIFAVGPDDWFVVIGDVCGKGVEAAVVTALVRYTLRGAAVQQCEPHLVLGVLNEVLLRQETDRYSTVAVLRLQRIDRVRQGWSATVSCGGHPLPMLIRPGADPVTVGRPGSLVGVLEHPDFNEESVCLAPGDAIVLYTDGVTEARRAGDFFGEEGLMMSLTATVDRSAAARAEGLLDDVLQFQSGYPRDDIAIVAVAVPADTEAVPADTEAGPADTEAGPRS